MTTANVPADFEEQVEQLRVRALQRIDAIPIAALIWGPTPIPVLRLLRFGFGCADELARRGHLANFSEELN